MDNLVTFVLITDNSIRSEGGKAIAEGLKTNTSLTDLDLDYSQFKFASILIFFFNTTTLGVIYQG